MNNKTRRPNWFLRAVIITILVSVAKLVHDAHGVPDLSADGWAGTLGDFTGEVLFTFLPVGIVVWIWAMIADHLIKPKKKT